ncbi:MAG TPA: thiolase domain-containing protein [Chloroflexi bacterium]|nr:thiolase domain-containing protein [Chloroflexota bacterium]|tara:strand:+ start:1529 stop:2692 length:1164 start_codon:yes stop_codon:yes gene_type:complete
MTGSTNIYVSGTGCTKVGEHWGTSLRHLAWEAVNLALLSSNTKKPDAIFVGNMLSSSLSQQLNVGALVADFCGFRGTEAITVEAAGASGAAALRQAILAIRSGEINTALVVGVEKMTDAVGPDVTTAIAGGADSDWELAHGLTAPAIAALIMRRYMYEHSVPTDGLSGFSVNAHKNASTNSYAMFRNLISNEQYSRGAMVSSPVNVFDSAPDADGAAALVITSSDRELVEGRSIQIAASNLTTDSLAIHDREDLLTFSAAQTSARYAYDQAGIDANDIDVAEIYDRFGVYAAMSLEACGFADWGSGWEMSQNGSVGLQGSLPISTFGGLKARGNPGGATGVYQIVEIAQQLAGTAKDNQVSDVKWALAQCLGSNGGTAVTHILNVIG